MLVEIKDRTLVERLLALLPRPDAPLDVAISMLLEKCKRELIVKAAVEEALKSNIDRIADRVAERVVEMLQGEGGWDAVVRALERSGGCLPFREIERVYGRSLNSEMLRKRGLVRREKGIWCLDGRG